MEIVVNNDKFLWSQFKNGDKEAFSRLYQLHSDSLVGYGLKLCSNRDAVKDAIQDLFVELWHSRENLAEVESIKFYLLKAMRYKIVRAQKKHQPAPFSLLHAENLLSRFISPVETEIINREMLDSQANVLRVALNKLTKRQQEVIQLRFYQGLSNDEIAQLMNMSYQSVSNLMYNALCRIRKNLETPVFAKALVAAFSVFL